MSAGLIREAQDRDAAAVTHLWTEAYVSEGEGGRTVLYSETDFFETFHSSQIFVAESEGAVAGVVALTAPGVPSRTVAQAEEAELVRLAVSAPARRLGIGQALTGYCHEQARAAGWGAIALWSRRYQTAAHRLYESLGYRRLPERDQTDSSGHELLVFRLLL